jgi:enoyl-CoA hydratase/carnithine racemase
VAHNSFWRRSDLECSEIEEIFEFASLDQRVHCVLVHAKGRHFTAGLDLNEAAAMANDNEDEAAEMGRTYKQIRKLQRSFLAIENCTKPSE